MKILLLAADEEMARTAREALADHADSLEIVDALLSRAIPVARRAESEAFDAIIVRQGGTAMLLRAEDIKVPVVEIPIGPQDVVEALAEACSLTGKERPRIGVVAFPNMTMGLEAFAPILQLDIRYYPLSREEDVHDALEAAVADGVEVVMGGVITSRLAAQQGVPAAMLRYGASSFQQAFREAERIAYGRRLEKQQAGKFKAILDYAHEGIVAINQEGRITVFNPVTERITGVRAGDALGRPARDVIPEARLTEALASGRMELNEMISLGSTQVLISRVPIMIHGQVTGVVGTLQQVTRILKTESKIRQEAYRKGHVARARFSHILGESAAMREAVQLARDFARTESAILLHGETGTGKELFAQGIHHESRRGRGPFVAVNCAALPESLLESELFGYVEGAFTGARRGGKPGLFELAHGGTLFLDEVSEIPLSLQGRLLRALQEHEVMRLGHDTVIPVDVRVISATNRVLNQRVEEGFFRPDLYFRLNVLSLRVPPLRDRPRDIPLLIDHFLAHRQGGGHQGLSKAAMDLLLDHPWPGNVRELENWCRRLEALSAPEKVVSLTLARRLLETTSSSGLSRADSSDEEIQRALRQSGGNLSQAAQALGVHRVTLWRRLKKANYRK